MKKATSIRADLYDIVVAAQIAGKPISAQIIWGLLGMRREVPEAVVKTLLSRMTRSRELVTKPGAPAVYASGKGRPPVYYETGPTPFREDRGTHDAFSRIGGNCEHNRLMAARKAARAWQKQGAAA